MGEHTPGPWWSISESGNTVAIRGGAHHYPLAKMSSYWDGPGPRREEMESNAVLIAAAPDFMAASERLIAVFDQQRMTNAERIIVGISDAGLKTEGNSAIDALRAAIAKAKGL